jgi:hypothetical protein
MVTELDANKVLAYLGLFLAALELYLPGLSLILERGLDRTAKALSDLSQIVFRSASGFRRLVRESWVGRMYYLNVGRILIIFGLILFVVFLVVLSDVIQNVFFDLILYALIFIPILVWSLAFLSLLAIVLVYIILSCLSVFVSGIAYLLHGLNFLGRGKAISGFGLVLAAYGVFTANL